VHVEWSLSTVCQSTGMARVIILIFFIVGLTLIFVGCNTSDNRLKHKFYYFPDKNVYYDIANQKFFYSLDEAQSWQTYTTSENTNAASLGKKIEIVSDDSLVYSNNEAHRKSYGGNMYKFNFKNPSLVANTPEVSERKIAIRKTIVTRPKIEKKEKKGLGKFIAKLFGKSKKK
jgi:hypothetical protein